MRWIYTTLLAGMIAVGFTPLLGAPAAEAAPLACGTWSVVPSPNAGTMGATLNGIAAVSASNVWAVGDAVTSSHVYQTLTERWNGTTWKLVPSPNVGLSQNFLHGVAGVATNNVWAVGSSVTGSGANQTLIERWNGTSWKVVPSPNAGSNGAILVAVAAVSANDIWAVGTFFDSAFVSHTLIEQWNGTTWKVVPSPNAGAYGSDLNGLTVVSANDVWAVGSSFNGSNADQTLIEQWNGTSWSIVPSINPSMSDTLNGVAIGSFGTVWAVGHRFSFSTPNQTLIEFWYFTQWVAASSPNAGSGDNALNGVAASTTSTAGWAVGQYANGSGVSQTLIEELSGPTWSVLTSPNVGTGNNFLNAVTLVPGSTTVWAVGGSISSSNINQTLILRYC